MHIYSAISFARGSAG